MVVDPTMSEDGDLEIPFAGSGTKGSFSPRGLGVLIALGTYTDFFGARAITGRPAGSGGRGHPVTRTRGRR